MAWTEKSACVANLPHLHKHTRERFLLVVSWCCCCIAVGSGAATTAAYSLVLSPHHLYNEKTEEKKNVTKSKESKELREGSFPQQLIFPVDMLTSPVAAARAAVATGAWVKSKHDVYLTRGSVGA